ncbi:MAG: hypothetical protein KDM64_06185, partial [Verrucomicrobiae bacterium]|nr:hypothetical protein [Verrucomicrobiae bacterium]
MEPITDFLPEAAHWTARNSLAASLLAASFLILVKAFGPRLHPKLVATLWVVVGLRLVLPFAPASPVGLMPGSFKATEPATSEMISGSLASSTISTEPVRTEENTVLVEATNPVEVKPQERGFEWPSILGLVSFVWVGVAIGILGRAVILQWRFARQIRRLPVVRDRQLLDLLKESSRIAGIRPDFTCVATTPGSGVAVFGWLRATHLLIPSDLSDRFTATEIRGMFLHELAHVRRGDLAWNWLTLAIQSLHWFNPLVWLAGNRFLAVRETLCDRAALTWLKPQERRDYGSALLKALELG